MRGIAGGLLGEHDDAGRKAGLECSAVISNESICVEMVVTYKIHTIRANAEALKMSNTLYLQGYGKVWCRWSDSNRHFVCKPQICVFTRKHDICEQP